MHDRWNIFILFDFNYAGPEKGSNKYLKNLMQWQYDLNCLNVEFELLNIISWF